MADVQLRAAAFVAALVVAAGAAAAGSARAGTATEPEFTLQPTSVVAGPLSGYGGQFNQHLYANISGPPPGLTDLETKVLRFEPSFVRVFFNTTEWTYADRMASFEQAVVLASRAHAQINVTWQGSTYAVAAASMGRFAGVLADLLRSHEVEGLWVTLFNEPNSTRLTLPQYEDVYRRLDSELRTLGVRDRVHFMGGDLVGTTSPLGQGQEAWFAYMAAHMGDLLDAWSIHVFWDYWDTPKIDRRLGEVRQIFSTVPAAQRRPLYVTEFGVRGLRTFYGETIPEPGVWEDGTAVPETNLAAFQEAWFLLRAAELGYVAESKWDFYDATYDNGIQDYAMVGAGLDGWPLRPTYHLMRLLRLVAPPTWAAVTVERSPAAAPSKLVAAYVSPAGNESVVGLDTDGAQLCGPYGLGRAVSYTVGGLAPNTLFRLLFWNGDGAGAVADVGYLDSGSGGSVAFSMPLGSVFALTSAPLASID